MRTNGTPCVTVWIVSHRVAGGGELPALDACNGHYGTVPANQTFGINSTCVYHYHWTDDVPNSIGCYGPVESLAACKALYLEDASSSASSATAGPQCCMDGFTDLLLADTVGGNASSVPVNLVGISAVHSALRLLHWSKHGSVPCRKNVYRLHRQLRKELGPLPFRLNRGLDKFGNTWSPK